jgi:hypothetical protein
MKAKLYTALLLGIILHVSCNLKQAPKCDNETAISEVKKMILDKIKSQFDNSAYYSPFDLSALKTQLDNIVKEKWTQLGNTAELVKPNIVMPSTDMETYIKAINYTGAYNEGKQLQEGYNKWRKEIEDSIRALHQPIIDKYKKDLESLNSLRLSVIDTLMNDLSLSINFQNIRITKKDDNIKKCDCEADLFSNQDQIRTMKYSAQFTEDGKIYITVYGLK